MIESISSSIYGHVSYKNTLIIYKKNTKIGFIMRDGVYFIFLYYYTDVGNSKMEEQQHQNFADESTTEPTASTGIGNNLIIEDDLKSTYAVDSPVC